MIPKHCIDCGKEKANPRSHYCETCFESLLKVKVKA